MQTRKNLPLIKTDFHTHILPKMDDGAADTKTSLRLLSSLYSQGIRTLAATPHFYLHKESPGEFLARRSSRSEQLMSVLNAETPLPKVLLGAEVYLEHDLAQTQGLERFCLADTEYVMFELPYAGCDIAYAELLYNLCRRNGIKPILAHLDRYFGAIPDSLMDDFLSFDDLIVQINCSAFDNRRTAKFARRLITQGYPVVFGSDTHNLTSRPPNFDICNKYLAAKFKNDRLPQLINLHERILNNK